MIEDEDALSALTQRPRTTVSTGRCAICGVDRVRTGVGQLHPLFVRGPKHEYLRYICEDCVALFNTTHWAKVRRLLKTLRHRRYGVGP